MGYSNCQSPIAVNMYNKVPLSELGLSSGLVISSQLMVFLLGRSANSRFISELLHAIHGFLILNHIISL